MNPKVIFINCLVAFAARREVTDQGQKYIKGQNHSQKPDQVEVNIAEKSVLCKQIPLVAESIQDACQDQGADSLLQILESKRWCRHKIVNEFMHRCQRENSPLKSELMTVLHEHGYGRLPRHYRRFGSQRAHRYRGRMLSNLQSELRSFSDIGQRRQIPDDHCSQAVTGAIKSKQYGNALARRHRGEHGEDRHGNRGDDLRSKETKKCHCRVGYNLGGFAPHCQRKHLEKGVFAFDGNEMRGCLCKMSKATKAGILSVYATTVVAGNLAAAGAAGFLVLGLGAVR